MFIFRLLHINKVEEFHGVSIYETERLGSGFDSAGLALPGIGIFVGKGTYVKACDINLVKHEYGHFLQAKEIGLLSFYLFVGIPSLISAMTNGWHKGHRNYWTEGWANDVAIRYFGSKAWPYRRFPPKNISNNRLKWIKWNI